MPTWHQQWCVWVLVLAWSVPDLWGWKMARCTRSAPEEPSASRLSSVDSFCRLYYFKLEQLKCSGGIDCCCVCVVPNTLFELDIKSILPLRTSYTFQSAPGTAIATFYLFIYCLWITENTIGKFSMLPDELFFTAIDSEISSCSFSSFHVNISL